LFGIRKNIRLSHPQQKKKSDQPKNVHSMPIDGRGPHAATTYFLSSETKLHRCQSENSARHARGVSRYEHVEKAAAHAGRESYSHGRHLLPTPSLYGQKSAAEHRRYAPPASELRPSSGSKTCAREQHRYTARHQQSCSEPKDARNGKRQPGAVRCAFIDHTRAEKRSEKHADSAQRDRNTSYVFRVRSGQRRRQLSSRIMGEGLSSQDGLFYWDRV
jgi:hypothetical protein